MPDIISMDVIYKSGGGIIMGAFYANNFGWSQVAAQNTWYNIIDAGITDSILHNVTHDGNGKLTVTYAGMYEILYFATMEIDTQNKHVETGVEITGSGAADVKGRSHYHLPNVAAMANTEFEISGGNIFDLADNATIEFAIQCTDTGTPTVMVDHINLMVKQLGGT